MWAGTLSRPLVLRATRPAVHRGGEVLHLRGHRGDEADHPDIATTLHAQGLLQNALRGLQVADALVQTAQRVQGRVS
jgi:hypothetical protein